MGSRQVRQGCIRGLVTTVFNSKGRLKRHFLKWRRPALKPSRTAIRQGDLFRANCKTHSPFVKHQYCLTLDCLETLEDINLFGSGRVYLGHGETLMVLGTGYSTSQKGHGPLVQVLLVEKQTKTYVWLKEIRDMLSKKWLRVAARTQVDKI